MRERGLRQPSGAREAWAEHTLPPIGWVKPKGKAALHTLSERMVLYCTTRKAYPASAELTVDYGVSYQRNYPSAKHKPAPQLYRVPAEVPCTAAGGAARWPNVPGWHNPELQPAARPAFCKARGGGAISVCRDDESLVRMRKAALGIETAAPCTATKEKKSDVRREPQGTITSMFAKRKRIA